MAQLKDLLVMGPGRVIGDAFFGGKLMPTITDTQDIGSSTIKWNNIYGTLKGNADTASYPEGFDNRVSNDIWGNDIGTAVTEWQMTNGGKIGFKNNNPQTGLLSLFINGRLYTSSSYPVPGLESSNSIWGLTDPDGATSNVAIRTPANGLYPYAPSNSTTAYSSLGAENWYFNTAYIKTIYGYLSGTAAKAEAPSATITNYGVAYYDNNGKFASTLQGSGDQALVGSSTGPSWADIATTLTITGAANTDTDKFQISVLGHNSGDAIGLTKATTSLYGVVKLSSSLSSSDTISAATPKAVLDAIAANATLNVSSTQYGLAYFTNTSGTIGSTGAGSGSQALTGNTTGGPPGWTDIDTTVTIVAGTSSATPKVTVKVLGIEATSGGITTASTSKYGATKLSSSAGSTENNVFTRNTSSALAATPSMVWAAIDTLDYNGATTSGSALEFITGVTQANGVITATKSTVQSADDDTAGVVDANAQSFKGDKTFKGETTFSNNTTTTGLATFNGNVKMNSSADIDSLSAGSLLIRGNTSLIGPTLTASLLPHQTNIYDIGSSSLKYNAIYAANFKGTADLATGANVTSPTSNAIVYLADSEGTFAKLSSDNGALYTTSTNGELQFGTLPLAQGGTNATSWTKYNIVYVDSSANALTGLACGNENDVLACGGNNKTPKWVTLDYTGATTSGSAIEFITSVTQSGGKISATKSTVQSADGDTPGVVDANEQTFKGHKIFSNNITVTGVATFNGNAFLNSATTADSLTAGTLVVQGNTNLNNITTTSTILPALNNSYNIGASGNKYATIYATTFDGTAEYAKKAYLAGASTGAQYGVLYLTASDKTIGATGQGDANTLLRAQGSNGAPYFDSISSSLSINAANKDNGQTISVAFMGVNGTNSVTLAKATATETVSGTTTNGVYGVTKLSHSIDNTKTVAATPYGVKTYVDSEINDLTADMPSSNGTATDQIVFVSSVTQSSGVVSIQTQTVRSATPSQSGVVTTETQSFAGAKTFTNAITVTGEANFNGNVHLNSSTIADSLQTGSLVVSGASSLINTVTTSNVIPASNNTYNIGTESNKYATIYATTFSGNASTATKLSNTPASNGTKVFLRGDNTWTNKLENTFESSGTPGFYANVAAGSWAYLRLQSGSTLYWDIAMKSNDNDGALQFRPAATSNKGPFIRYAGNMWMANAGTTDASNTTSALTLRETGYAGAGTDNWTTAPRLAFNWSGRKYAQIGLASNGYLYTAPNSQQANWYKIMYESGTWTININGDSTSCSGNAASASTVFASLSTSEKTYLLGTTSSLTANGDNVELTGDSGVYLTENTGEISAVRHSWNYSGTEKAYTIWNNSTNSIDIMFL